MKRILFTLLPAMALLGQGCPLNPVDRPVVPSMPAITETGCTPKNITVYKPQAGSTQSLPLRVDVLIENRRNPNCSWTLFEAQAGLVQLFDSTGAEVGATPLMTSDEWMTDGPVAFSATITPTGTVAPGAARILITEEDPSGMGDVQTVEIPFFIQ